MQWVKRLEKYLHGFFKVMKGSVELEVFRDLAYRQGDTSAQAKDQGADLPFLRSWKNVVLWSVSGMVFVQTL